MNEIPFAIGEEFSSKWDAGPYLEQGLTQFMRLDICNIGGFTDAMKVAGWCERQDVDLMPHNPPGPVCTAGTAHLATAVANLSWVETRQSPFEALGFHDPKTFPRQVAMEGPVYVVPETPGLGVEDTETILLKAFNGEIDYMTRHIGRPPYKAVLTDNAERGQYSFWDTNDLPANTAIVMFNLNAPDPIKREVISNLDFRKGVSHAMNRQEIIDLIYLDSAQPAQTIPQPASGFYNEEWATQFTEYDPDLANEYLDKAGLAERDDEGVRLGPDDNRFTLIFLVADVFGLQYPDVMELVAASAADVGLDFQVRATDRSRLFEITEAGEHDAYIWNCGGGMADAFSSPQCYVPTGGSTVFWAPKWAEWRSDPSKGEEPPAEVLAIVDE